MVATDRSSSHDIVPSIATLNHVAPGFVDPLLTSSAYHVHQAETALSSLKQIIRESEGWKKTLKHKSGVVVYMKAADKAPIFKGEAIIHGFSPQTIFYVIGMRKLWDSQYEDGALVENLNETTSLTYEVDKGGLFASFCGGNTIGNKPRDTALVEKIECTGDDAIFFACTSVETPRVPRVQGRVRADIKLLGWVLQPIGGAFPATRVTFVIQENLKGWVPGFAKKSMARRPLAIALVNEYLQKKMVRTKINRAPVLPLHSPMKESYRESCVHRRAPIPFQTDGLSSRSHATSRDLLREKGTSSSTSSTRKHINFVENDTARSDSPLFELAPEPSSISTLSSIEQQSLLPPECAANTTQKTQIPESTAEEKPQALSLYPTHRHVLAKSESINMLKTFCMSDVDEQWILQEDHEDVKMYTDKNEKWIRFDGIISGGWSPQQLCSTVFCVGARKVWDSLFHSGTVLERFSQKDYLVSWLLRDTKSTLHHATLLASIETDPSTGTVYTAATSVTDALSDATSKPIDLYGWVFHPCSRGTQAMYISNIEWADNPLVRLNNYLNQRGCPPYIRRVAGKVIKEEFDDKTGKYLVTYIAKHRQNSKTRAWCTDIRVHASRYPHGFDITVAPASGTRVDVSSTLASVRIYTTDDEMEGQRVEVELTANKPPTKPSQKREKKQPSNTEESLLSTQDQQQSQTSNIVTISNELTFNGQQLALIFLVMVLCYYTGKLACATC